MKLTKNALFVTLVLSSLLLGACGGSADNNGNSAEVLTEAAQIAFQALTETAAAAPPTATSTDIPPTPTNTPELPTATPTPQGTLPTATPTQQSASNGGGESNKPCLRANFEIETIPDGTKFYVNAPFTKTWRLKNTGSCTWTPGFAVIWVQGDIMSADSVVPFTTVDIPPGGYAEISVNMKAPSPDGHYRGYWMLRSADGIIFGVGNTAREWFWVAIESIPVTQ